MKSNQPDLTTNRELLRSLSQAVDAMTFLQKVAFRYELLARLPISLAHKYLWN